MLLKYLDKISYLKIYKYLNENFNFNPIILHSDFENALSLAKRESNFFKKNYSCSMFISFYEINKK